MPDDLGFNAALVAAGAAGAKILDWLLRLRKDRREASADAIELLTTAMAEQRTELDRLARRMVAATEAEDRCMQRLRLLQGRIDAMEGALRAAGVAVPPQPDHAPVGAD